ncbi:ABC transporter ATP-binding protein/permease [Suttonella sp. R2A3]|uniref:ABC transporter ATP-binding protein n=1 Tax=Suttonella sp. R2A3 TaxID=2908648 RepID=UPI001F1ECA10|nr:ABC transporter ATP-binding protein [Suttonella sp. R2A3]UJF25129.1 ABC transporter ATP-binding protein/permease [Suttonella sp. R2A3]
MDNSTLQRRTTSFRELYRMVCAAAGAQAPLIRRSLLLGIITAVLRGVAFVGFTPLFFALQQQLWRQVLLWLLAMTALLLLSSISDWFSRNYDHNGHAARAGDALRRALGQHLRRMPLQALYRKRSGELNAAIAGDVDDVLNYSMTVGLMLINAVVTPIATGIGTLFFDWRLAVALLLVFPAVLPIFLWVRPLLSRHKQVLADANANLNAETVEYTQGLPVLKAAGCIGDKAARFQQAVRAVETAQITAMREEAPANILLASVVEIGILLIVALGLWLVSNGDIGLMVLAGLMVAVVRFAEPLSMFIGMSNIFIMVENGYHRLQVLLDIAPLSLQQPQQIPTRYDITFDALTFCYAEHDEPALKDICLNIPEHALTALVGSSGCGKTTLIRMLMRYADPQFGSVHIGGIDIRRIEPEILNRLIAVVFQDVYLFDDSILANIRMGRGDATDEEIYAAAKAAHCHDFIKRLPQGYDTRVGDIGGNLSGGEKQRISIARALLKDAPIIILDEPTAALDTQSELAVQQAIDALVRNKTVIVIAHRLSTIVAAQQIVVLDEGTVLETGTHQNLLDKNGRYAKLWRMQQYVHAA